MTPAVLSAPFVPFVPLRTQLVRQVMLAALFCALLASVAQAFLVSSQARRSFDRAVNDFTRAHMAPLSAALWDIDSEQIRAQLSDIASREPIAGVRLITAAGIEFLAGALPPDRAMANAAGSDHVALDIKRLTAGGTDASAVPLGRLFVGFNRALLTRNILIEAGKIIAFIMIFTALLCAMMFRVLRSKVTAPLTKLRAHVSSLTPETLGRSMPPLRPAGKWRDEMDMVADGFQTLHSGIERYVGERNLANEQLQKERDQLDATVRDRTAALSKLNQFLATVSNVTLRFLNVERADFPAAVQKTIRELAELTASKKVCLAQRRGAAHDTLWFWQEFNAHEMLRVGAGFELPLGGSELEVLRINNANVTPNWADVLQAQQAGRAVLCRRDSETHGYLLALFDQQDETLGDREVTLLAETLFSTLARWRSLQEVEDARAELTTLSNTDALTGIANRRYFVSHRIGVAQQAFAGGQGLAVIMVDIDHFKRYNDTYGHDEGDNCLVAVARAASQALTASILFARLGGEEFAALFACDSVDEAAACAESVRKAVQALAIDHTRGENGRVSVSLGVGFVRTNETEPTALQPVVDALMRHADQALYKAKRAGRNIVAIERMAWPKINQ